MRVFYYPGCSSEHLARDFHLSVETLFSVLGIEIENLEDWNCCGAREIHDYQDLLGLSLAARNLALAEKGDLLVTACSLCFFNLKRAEKILREDQDLLQKINTILGEADLSYHPGKVHILHLLEFLSIKEILSRLLKQIKGKDKTSVVPYYGCFLSRPFPFDLFTMEKILRILGYEVKPFTLKSHCCGGHLPRTNSPIIQELCGRILLEAEMRGADFITVTCPVCKLNLEIYGFREGLPRIIYFTQLIGLRLGLPSSLLGLPGE